MNDTIPYTDAWTDDSLWQTALEVYGTNMQAERFPTSRAIYDEVDASAVFRIYEGVAHTPRPAEDDLVRFHERALNADDIEAIQADLGRNVPNRRTAIRMTPQKTRTGTQVAFHAIESDLRDTEIKSYQWKFGDGETTTGKAITHTFDSAGQYRVMLTTTGEAGRTYQSTEYVDVQGDGSGEDDRGNEMLQITLSPSSIVSGEQATITVIVTDESDSPVPDVVVEISEFGVTATTDTSGEATISINPSDTGDYEVLASATDYTDATEALTVEGQSGLQDPTQRALQITGKNDPSDLTQNDVTATITRFNRGQSVNGIDITQNDVTTMITLFERNKADCGAF